MRIFGFSEYGDASASAVLEVPDPTPGPGQVLVQMAAAGVNPADIKVRSGQRRDTVEVNFPMAMGREAAGIVLAVGDGVDGFAVGDRVFGATAAGTGSAGEQVLLDADSTAAIPDGVSAEQAACIPVSLGTAFDALRQLALPPGSRLVVLGAGGGVGSAALQFARADGLHALGVASESKRELVEELGGEFIASGDGWAERVRAASPGGVDAVLDTVGAELLDDAAGLLTPPIRLLSTADPARAEQLEGAGVGRRRSTAVFTEIAELVADGTVAPVISAVLPLDRAAEAVATVEQGHTLGNVVLVPAGDGEPR